MDITESLAPASDQLDAIELIAAPRTFTIESVSAGSAEQPVDVHLVGFPRVWRPSKGMRRVLAAGWGVDASEWSGRSVTLFLDPNVSFGRERTGGTRISHMTDLPGNKRLSVPLLISRGKSAIFTVEPLVESATQASVKRGLADSAAGRVSEHPDFPDPEPTAEQVAASTDADALRAMWQASGVERRAQIEARVNELAAEK